MKTRLNEEVFRVDFKSFDILSDDEVREGLKKFSNWPTYPQLYVNGELIGGVDIVKVQSNCFSLISRRMMRIRYTSPRLKSLFREQ